jgi:sugar diacid utilization regulator
MGGNKMDITTRELFSLLSDDLQQVKLSRGNQEIHKINLLLKGQRNFDSNTLYVGKTSFLDKDNPSPVPAFLGLNDCGILPEQLSRYFTDYALLKNNCDLHQLFNKAQDILSREQSFLHSSATLLHSLIKGRGLQYIIDMGYQLLNNPMLLVDTSYKLLAYTKKDQVDDLVWNELVTKGYCSYDLVSIFKKEGVVKKIADSKDPLLTDTGFSEKIRRIHGKIIINNKLVGYLGVLEHNQKFKKEDYRTIQLLCDVISEEMQKNRNYYHIKGLMYENILIDLLDNTIQNREHLRERLKTAGLKLESNLYLIVIDFHNEDIANYHLVDFLRDYIDHQLTCSRSIFYQNQIITFISKKDEQIEKIMSKLEKCLKDYRLQAGISARFKNIANLQRAYRQAQKALEIGSCLFSLKTLFYYPDYRIYHLLGLADKNHQLKDLLHPAPLKLKEYDAQKETNLYSTLYTYLGTDKNTMLSAEKLFIHRNTMNYRLKQIAEVTALDFNNFEECVLVYLTYKILELESMRGEQI